MPVAPLPGSILLIISMVTAGVMTSFAAILPTCLRYFIRKKFRLSVQNPLLQETYFHFN